MKAEYLRAPYVQIERPYSFWATPVYCHIGQAKIFARPGFHPGIAIRTQQRLVAPVLLGVCESALLYGGRSRLAGALFAAPQLVTISALSRG